MNNITTTNPLSEEDQLTILTEMADSLKRRRFRTRNDIDSEDLMHLGWIGVRSAIVTLQVKSIEDPRAYFARCAARAMVKGLYRERVISPRRADGTYTRPMASSLDVALGEDADGASLLAVIADRRVHADFSDEQRDNLHNLMATLPPKMQQIVKLKFLDDLSNYEISTLLECSEDGVKRVCTDAMNMLRMRVFSDEVEV